MTDPAIEQKVREVLARKFAVPAERIRPETRLAEDLKIDSFGGIELMFELEEAFNVQIPDASIARVRTVRDITDYLANLLSRPS